MLNLLVVGTILYLLYFMITNPMAVLGALLSLVPITVAMTFVIVGLDSAEDGVLGYWHIITRWQTWACCAPAVILFRGLEGMCDDAIRIKDFFGV